MFPTVAAQQLGTSHNLSQPKLGVQPDESPCTHLVVLLPEDVRRRLGAVDEAGEVEAGRVVHVQLVLAQDLRARLWKQCKWITSGNYACIGGAERITRLDSARTICN